MKIDVLPNSDVVAQEAAKFIAAEARAGGSGGAGGSALR
jgi:hypothetical protein